MNNSDNKIIYETIFNNLSTFLVQKKIDSDTALDIYQMMKRAVQDLQENHVLLIEDKIKNWEEMSEGGDTTLYTLGLRHALDIITGKTATDFNGFDGEKYVPEQPS